MIDPLTAIHDYVFSRGKVAPDAVTPSHAASLPPVRQKEKPGPGRPPDGLIDKARKALMLERDDMLVFNKPAGLAVHAGSGLRFGLIEILRVARQGEYVELVHRLDRQTSGCLLVARSRAALDALRAGLNDAIATKRYLALVDGHWKEGAIEVDAPLSRDVERSGEIGSFRRWHDLGHSIEDFQAAALGLTQAQATGDGVHMTKVAHRASPPSKKPSCGARRAAFTLACGRLATLRL